MYTEYPVCTLGGVSSKHSGNEPDLLPVCTLDRPMTTLDIQCVHWISIKHTGYPVSSLAYPVCTLGENKCPVTSLGACSSIPAAAASSNFSAAVVKTPLMMDYSWLLLRCMDAYQWLGHRSPLIRCHSTASAQHIALKICPVSTLGFPPSGF